MKEKKSHNIHIRVSNKEREAVKILANKHGYKSTSKFIMDSALNKVQQLNDSNEPMTHIITLSPTIDYYINMSKTESDDNNIHHFNSSEKMLIPGGRGVNVSRIMNNFNSRNITVHYSGGFVGEFIFDQLDKLGINQKRIKSNDNSRINLKLKNVNNEDYIIDQNSDLLSEYGKEEILKYISENVLNNEFVVIAGSFKVEDTPYIEQLSMQVKSKGARLVFNIYSENILELCKKCKPDFVAINMIDKNKNISKARAKNLLSDYLNAGVPVVSFIVDTNFIYFGDENGMYFADTPTSENQMPIGLADALVAGLLSNWDSKDPIERYVWAATSVYSKSINQFGSSYEEILSLREKTIIKEI